MDNTITINSIIGNIRENTKLTQAYQTALSSGTLECVRVRRWEASKSRFRGITDKMNTILIDIPRGTIIRHGDVLNVESNRMIIVEWLEEDVIVASFGEDTHRIPLHDAVKLGYCLGNLHCPVELRETDVIIPLESRKESLGKLLSKIAGIKITLETRVVEPSLEVDQIDHK